MAINTDEVSGSITTFWVSPRLLQLQRKRRTAPAYALPRMHLLGVEPSAPQPMPDRTPAVRVHCWNRWLAKAKYASVKEIAADERITSPPRRTTPVAAGINSMPHVAQEPLNCKGFIRRNRFSPRRMDADEQVHFLDYIYQPRSVTAGDVADHGVVNRTFCCSAAHTQGTAIQSQNRHQYPPVSVLDIHFGFPAPVFEIEQKSPNLQLFAFSGSCKRTDST